MKNLLLLRHAKSSWDDESVADHDRPLARRGLRDAPRMGQLLRSEHLVPELILSSTAARALATSTMVAQAASYDRELRTVPELYLAEPAVYMQVIRAVDDRCSSVMLVGHNPGLEELLVVLTRAEVRMPTASLAHVRLDVDHWADVNNGQGELVRVWRPKEL